jgi:hypothetical protein
MSVLDQWRGVWFRTWQLELFPHRRGETVAERRKKDWLKNNLDYQIPLN